MSTVAYGLGIRTTASDTRYVALASAESLDEIGEPALAISDDFFAAEIIERDQGPSFHLSTKMEDDIGIGTRAKEIEGPIDGCR